MKVYLDFLKHIIDSGVSQENRTAIDTISTFGYQYRVDVSKGFPLLTTKRVHLKSVIVELLWFLSGDTNIKYLVDNDCRIWNEWPYEKFCKSSDYNGETMQEFVELIKTNAEFAKIHGELGPVYGYQWRNFESGGKVVDQIQDVIDQIKTNPRSRRLIVNAWNAARIEDMALPPCHMMFQFYVSSSNKLSLQLYQRSADAFLGVPFNLASYSLLLMMVAKVCDLEVGEFIHTIGDAHIYVNHLEQVELQMSRTPYELSTIDFPKKDSIFDYELSDFELKDYKCHKTIKGSVAV